MERNYDEVISDMLIQLAAIEAALEKQNKRMESFDKRMELSIRRMVKAESRLEQHEKGMETLNTNMKTLNEKLERSIKDQREFSRMQNQMNRYFLNAIKNKKK
jgi:predicted RNA-binding protein with RPS1 domain